MDRWGHGWFSLMFGSPDRHGGGRHPPGIRQHDGPLHAAVQQAAVRGRKSGHRHASGIQGQEELQGMHEEGAYGPTARNGVFFCLPLSRAVRMVTLLAKDSYSAFPFLGR